MPSPGLRICPVALAINFLIISFIRFALKYGFLFGMANEFICWFVARIKKRPGYIGKGATSFCFGVS